MDSYVDMLGSDLMVSVDQVGMCDRDGVDLPWVSAYALVQEEHEEDIAAILASSRNCAVEVYVLPCRLASSESQRLDLVPFGGLWCRDQKVRIAVPVDSAEAC